MRDIKYLVLHCTATPHNTTIKSILNYWQNTLKWKSPGYHYIYEANGNEVQLQGINKPTNGVANYNANSIHLSYIGGIDSKGKSVDNRTEEQKYFMERRVRILKNLFPNAEVLGHRDFPKVAKDCPCFDARAWFKEFQNKKTL